MKALLLLLWFLYCSVFVPISFADDFTTRIDSPKKYTHVAYTGFRIEGIVEGGADLDQVLIYLFDCGGKGRTAFGENVSFNTNNKTWYYDVREDQMTPNGELGIWVRAIDVEGNLSGIGFASVYAALDKPKDVTPACVSISTPAVEATVDHCGFIFSGTAWDEHSAVEQVRVHVYDETKKKYTILGEQANFNAVTGEWSYAVPERAITPGGRHRLWVGAQDTPANPIAFTRRNINADGFVDVTPPTLSIETPLNTGQTDCDGFVFAGRALDDTSVEVVEVFAYDSYRRACTMRNEVAAFDTETNAWSFDVTRDHMTPGAELYLYARAKDPAGNWCRSQFQRIIVEEDEAVDVDPPTLSIVTPAPQENISSSGIVFKGTVFDEKSAVDRVLIFIYDFGIMDWTAQSQPADYDPGTGEWSFAVKPERMSAGARLLLWVMAWDEYDNGGDAKIYVNCIDDSAPILSITAPVENAELPIADIVIKGSVEDESDVFGVWLSIHNALTGVELLSNQSAEVDGNTWHTTVQKSLLIIGGRMRFSVNAKDVHGNTAVELQREINIENVDIAPPIISAVFPLDNDELEMGQQFRARVRVDDASDIAYVRGFINDEDYYMEVMEEGFSHVLDTSEWSCVFNRYRLAGPDVKNFMFVVAEDVHGQKSDVLKVQFKAIEGLPPQAPTVCSVPAYTKDNSITIRGTKEEHAEIWINGVLNRGASVMETEWVATLSLAEDGDHLFSIQSVDSSGASDAVEFVITRDTTSPEYRYTEPLHGSSVFTLPLSVKVYTEQGLASVSVNSVCADEIEPGVWNVWLDQLSVGVHALSIKLKDKASNTTLKASEIEYVDVLDGRDISMYAYLEQEGAVLVAGEDIEIVCVVYDEMVPVPGENIAWELVCGDAALNSGISETTVDGIARVVLHSNGDASEDVLVSAVLEDNSEIRSELSIPIVAANLASIAIISPVADAYPCDARLLFDVVLQDQYGNGISGESLYVVLVAGNGTVSNDEVITNEKGVAMIQFHTGPNREERVSLRISSARNDGIAVVVSFDVAEVEGPLALNEVVTCVENAALRIYEFEADVTIETTSLEMPAESSAHVWIQGDKKKVEQYTPTNTVYVDERVEDVPAIIAGMLEPVRTLLKFDADLNEYHVKSVYPSVSTNDLGDSCSEDGEVEIIEYIDGAEFTIKTREVVSRVANQTVRTLTQYQDVFYVDGVPIPHEVLDIVSNSFGDELYRTRTVYSNVMINHGITESFVV